MARGRKAKPTRLKILSGNPGKRKLNDAEPMLEAGAPDPPDYLDEAAREEWDRICRELEPVRVLTKGDFGVVLVACSAFSRMRQCDKFLKKKGSISYAVMTQTGEEIYRPYPEVAQLNQAERRYLSALAELGLSPTSRTKVKSLPVKETQGVGRFFGAI